MHRRRAPRWSADAHRGRDAGGGRWNCLCRRIAPAGSRPRRSNTISGGESLGVALSEMYVQGVSTRTVKAITEELCGHEFSASARTTRRWTPALRRFATGGLRNPVLVWFWTRCERVREAGIVVSQALLIAVAVDLEGRRQVLAVELANRESQSSWREFLLGLKERGLNGVEFVVSDDHPGLQAATREVLA